MSSDAATRTVVDTLHKLNFPTLAKVAGHFYQDPGVPRNIEADLTDFVNKFGDGDVSVATLGSLLTAAEHGFVDGQARITDLRAEIDEAKTKIAVAHAAETQLRTQVATLQQQVTTQAQQVVNLSANITDLNTQLHHERARAPGTTASVPGNRRQALDPEKFRGKEKNMSTQQVQDKCDAWLTKVTNVLKTDAAIFDTEQKRIAHIGALLEGEAYQSMIPGFQSVSTDNPELWMWKSSNAVLAEIRAKYIVIDPVQAAKQTLDNSKQGTKQHFPGWFTTVLGLMARAKYTNEQQVEWTKKNMNERMRNALDTVLNRPSADDWTAWKTLLHQLDSNRTETEHLAKIHKTDPAYRSGWTGNDVTDNSTPVNANATDADGDTEMLQGMRISQEERNHRRTNGLCMACGEAGHQAHRHHGPNAIPMPLRAQGGQTRGGSRGNRRGGRNQSSGGRGGTYIPNQGQGYYPQNWAPQQGPMQWGQQPYQQQYQQGPSSPMPNQPMVPWRASSFGGRQFTNFRQADLGGHVLSEMESQSETMSQEPSSPEQPKGQPLN